MDDYVREFVDETEAAITTLNNLLLDLERSPADDEVVQDIFRTAHTVKGNAGAMGLERASDLAHAIEDVLDGIRAGTVEVSPERMDTLFAAVDCLERMVDEVARDGTIQTDPADVIASLREPLTDDSPDVTPPSPGEREAILTRFDPPANSAHDAYLVRMAIADSDELNNGLVVIEALVDAFDLIGTDPSRTAIENEEHGNRIDAVFAAAVDEEAISAALEPVGAVEAFSILGVTDELDSSEDDSFSSVEENLASDLSTDQANEMSVDDLLDEFTELDDIDALADEIDDTSEFEDIGDAGSFDDLIPETTDESSTAATEPDPEPTTDDEDNVEDAGAVFDELKQEVDMVGFDELQDELEALEFDEFDEEEVGMDELLGEDVDVDDPTFLDLDEPDPSDPIGTEAPPSESADASAPTWGAPEGDEPATGGVSAEPDSTPVSTADPDAGSAEGAGAAADATETDHTESPEAAESSNDSSATAAESSAFADELFGGATTDPVDDSAPDQPAADAADTPAESGADGSGDVESPPDVDRADGEPEESDSDDVAVAPPVDGDDVAPVDDPDSTVDDELAVTDEPVADDEATPTEADEAVETESSLQPATDTDADSSPTATDLADDAGLTAGEDDSDAIENEGDGSTVPSTDPTPEPTDGDDESGSVDDESLAVGDDPTPADAEFEPIGEPTESVDEFEGVADDSTEPADETTATAPAASLSDGEHSTDDDAESGIPGSESTPAEGTDVGDGDEFASSPDSSADEAAEPVSPSAPDAETEAPAATADTEQGEDEPISASNWSDERESDADTPADTVEASADPRPDTAETATGSDDGSTDSEAPAFDLSTGLDELTQNEDSDEDIADSSADMTATWDGDTSPGPDQSGPSETVASDTDATADPASADDADSRAEWLTEPLVDEDGGPADESSEARDSATSATDVDTEGDDHSSAAPSSESDGSTEDDPETLGFDDATIDSASDESDMVSEPASSSDAADAESGVESDDEFGDAESDVEPDDGFGDAFDDEPSSVGFGSDDESTVDLSGLEDDAERSEDTEFGTDDAFDSGLDDEISFTDDGSDDTAFADDLDAVAFDTSSDVESTDATSDSAFDADLDLDSDDFGLDATPADEFDADSQAESETAFDSVGDQSASFQTEADEIDTSGTDFDAGDDPEDEVLAGLPEMTVPDISVPTEASPDTDTDLEAHSQSVRVERDQVDSLLQLVEGLVTSRVRLRSAIESREPYETLERELDDLEDFTAELQETVMDVRLVPLQTVTNRLPRVVRDLAREQDKQVTFDQSNADVELDRGVLDRIGDPLIHLVRNAVDHGIESVESRKAAGKDPEGTIELSANRTQNRVTIDIADDGSGLDADRLREEAVDADILTRDEADELLDEAAYDLVFNSGLSTKEQVTDVSGRGVGMDVVRRTVDELNGSVSIHSEPGEGTTVTMTLPVSVAVDDVLFVESGGEQFGIPVDVVRDVADGADVVESDGELVYEDGEESLPVVELSSALEVDDPRSSDPDGMLVRVRDDVRPVALKCDVVRTRREVVITPFEGFMRNVPGISGATVRGRGEVITILDVSTL
ncbi:chemotaxis protein histidine kinase-like protein [Halovivax ruber XH-70]|uniref:Chemotaxis protein CheA n=1 Tax=Halovivax ruber (strain DSM 18193 / JCM 13892 / XH-70) TaxID=797302 RepID=L0I8J2_HALRX|nr:ATP-binding protein [Halovivax ruber]AGB15900.1 chemotaxis protein histidine kinase-like protein [Halovivax ruber XH-70]